ncbi:respiratory nitrate reductase chaperone NarJ [Oryzisolibacter propanilivorax]|uniref:Respiratory nitrate reductase chaperone NarJ n=1 Tax=Oryzisolibacter propanilivorax TaxID=1527607 RepID=A0A1G9SB08_9BURK|nr:nitrate reductase molybdenum cofactor assembly chaperone [Oryzisolibacter propanilivorax]SDM32664.1 respiratory nitrate reductase chaperone NarJ [Oryzisolibacter propanilivorax]
MAQQEPHNIPVTQRVAGRHPGAVSLRVLGALLGYPDAALREHLYEMEALLAADGVLSASRRAGVAALVRHLQEGEPLAVETEYVELFDRGRATSLYLFEHVHGDSRDRGPAMIDLGETYAKAGLLLVEDELPDYLPAVLEFVSTQPPREAKGFLGEIAHLLDAVHAALVQRTSPYAAALAALLDLAGHKPKADTPVPVEPPLDESWQEPAAFDGCSSAGQARPGQPQPVHIVRKNPLPSQGA